MTAPDVGPLQSLDVRLDDGSSRFGIEWKLERVSVTHPVLSQTFVFECGEWLGPGYGYAKTLQLSDTTDMAEEEEEEDETKQEPVQKEEEEEHAVEEDVVEEEEEVSSVSEASQAAAKLPPPQQEQSEAAGEEAEAELPLATGPKLSYELVFVTGGEATAGTEADRIWVSLRGTGGRSVEMPIGRADYMSGGDRFQKGQVRGGRCVWTMGRAAGML